MEKDIDGIMVGALHCLMPYIVAIINKVAKQL